MELCQKKIGPVILKEDGDAEKSIDRMCKMCVGKIILRIAKKCNNVGKQF